MLLKLKKILSTDLVKVTSLNSVATLVRMMTGLISVKVVASKLHPEGVALLGQLTSFSMIFLSISGAGIKNGITKNVRSIPDHKKDTCFFSQPDSGSSLLCHASVVLYW